jgi:hypothetical protein
MTGAKKNKSMDITKADPNGYLVFSVAYSHHVEGFQGFVAYVCARVGMALP